MGHDDRERRPLAPQATILAPLTEQFLMRAGIRRGMTVLDLGCGVGDVTLIAARLAGPGGALGDPFVRRLSATRRYARANPNALKSFLLCRTRPNSLAPYRTRKNQER